VAGEQQRYAHGWWASAYVLDPVERPPSLPQFRDLLYAIKGSETGWPVWLWLPNRAEMLPYLIDDDVIECWLSAIGDDSTRLLARRSTGTDVSCSAATRRTQTQPARGRESTPVNVWS